MLFYECHPYRDLVHPLNRAAREEIERAVFAAYEAALQEEQLQPPQQDQQAEPAQ